MPIWQNSGDTLFFHHINHRYYATDFDAKKPTFKPADHLNNISIMDYTKAYNDKTTIVWHSKVYLFDLKENKVVQAIMPKPGYYSNQSLTPDLKKMVFVQNTDGHRNKIIYVVDIE